MQKIVLFFVSLSVVLAEKMEFSQVILASMQQCYLENLAETTQGKFKLSSDKVYSDC